MCKFTEFFLPITKTWMPRKARIEKPEWKLDVGIVLAQVSNVLFLECFIFTF